MMRRGRISKRALEILCCLSAEPIRARIGDIIADTGIDDPTHELAALKDRFGLIGTMKSGYAIPEQEWLRAQAACEEHWSKTRRAPTLTPLSQ
jgi:hypothetical protein